MTFKRNLPVAIALALAAGGLVALVVHLQPADDELLRDAAVKYGSTLGVVRGAQIHSPIVDIDITGRPLLHAEFVKRQGTWTFSKDVGADFGEKMKKPAESGEILKHLTQRIADTDNVQVTPKEGMGFKYAIRRDGPDLIAEVDVPFSYPKPGGQRGSGLFIEVFRYADGAWQSISTNLYKQGPPPRPR